MDLKARIPDVRTTDDYQVISIPYQPFPFTNPGGILVDPSYLDDRFSPVIVLPFTFCFYGQTYTSCTVGTNGIVSFDISNAGLENGYLLPDPIPSAVGTQNTDTYYPKATIMGPYHDIDPSTATPQQPDKKMEYIIVGNAPCRKFILNFYKIPYYNCGSAIVTQQMVLYEGTGIIDIFLKDKPFACGASITQTAILGIQNWNRDKAVWVPGRNNTSWSATNEGWRFVPHGATSLLNRVELYKNGTLIANDPAPVVLGNGELEATFTNICQAEDSMSYVVRAFYQQCDNPALETEGSDTMIVYKTLNPLTTTVTDALCNTGNGTVTVNSPTGANIEYSANGGATWQTSTVFNLPAGNYTILARVIGSLCGGSTAVTVAEPTAITLLAPATDADCSNKTGTITITASGGTPGYQYSIDNGVTYLPSNQFINLATGNYTVKVKDANNCIQSIAAAVQLLDTMYLDLGADSTICFGNSITLLPSTNALTDTFKWTPAATLNYDTVRTPVATPTDTTKYYVTAKWGICQRKDSVTINVLHKPVPNAGSDTIICYKTTATLKGTASNLSGTVNYSWAPPATLATPNAAITLATPDTTQQYFLTVTDNYGCNFSVTDSVWVYMQSPVNAFAGNDTNAILGRPHQLMATGGANYSWSPAAPLNNPFIANPLATLFNDTYFSVLVTDSIGCTGTDYVFVKVYEGPTYYLPNAFSPNGDGLNDIFRPIPVGIRSTDYFRVFDRYGALMFETKQWMEGWDGTIKGKPASSGTYVWMIKGIDKNGSVVEMKGTVILVR